ncbi:MAG: PTS sugar transporter subunit IIB [Clostridiales Family XIII bacterium]|jgi:PTS system mannose-specific IIB component|nr:PTS sugar transporter subunit IIB [Clostridiales Family XIII bacterium]
MIKQLRVDERLIHGQITLAWTKALEVDAILVANDAVASNPALLEAQCASGPADIKCAVRDLDGALNLLTDKRAESMKMLVLVRTICDAVYIAEHIHNIEEVNIGNIGKAIQAEKTALCPNVMLTCKGIDNLKKLIELYPDAYIQNIPRDVKRLAREVLNEVF